MACPARTLGIVIASEASLDLVFHRLIPWPSLFGLESPALRDEDVVGQAPHVVLAFLGEDGDLGRDHRHP